MMAKECHHAIQSAVTVQQVLGSSERNGGLFALHVMCTFGHGSLQTLERRLQISTRIIKRSLFSTWQFSRGGTYRCAILGHEFSRMHWCRGGRLSSVCVSVNTAIPLAVRLCAPQDSENIPLFTRTLLGEVTRRKVTSNLVLSLLFPVLSVCAVLYPSMKNQLAQQHALP